MHAFRSLSARRAYLLLLLVACAMLVRASIPAGWMPVADAHGVRIVMCSGTGPIGPIGPVDHAATRAMAGMHHGGTPAHPDSGPDHPCAFAGIAVAFAAPAFALPSLAPLAAAVPAPTRMLVAIGHGLAAPPPPQTGPPSFV